MSNKTEFEQDGAFFDFLIELDAMGPQEFVRAVQSSEFDPSEIQAGFSMLNKQDFVRQSCFSPRG